MTVVGIRLLRHPAARNMVSNILPMSSDHALAPIRAALIHDVLLMENSLQTSVKLHPPR